MHIFYSKLLKYIIEYKVYLLMQEKDISLENIDVYIHTIEPQILEFIPHLAYLRLNLITKNGEKVIHADYRVLQQQDEFVFKINTNLEF